MSVDITDWLQLHLFLLYIFLFCFHQWLCPSSCLFNSWNFHYHGIHRNTPQFVRSLRPVIKVYISTFVELLCLTKWHSNQGNMMLLNSNQEKQPDTESHAQFHKHKISNCKFSESRKWTFSDVFPKCITLHGNLAVFSGLSHKYIMFFCWVHYIWPQMKVKQTFLI